MQKLIQFMQEGFGGIKIIKLLGREKFFFNKFKIYNFNLSKIFIKSTHPLALLYKSLLSLG